ncbi:sigma-70 family RNA polymerase sigma factor [Aquisphaera insulae]|uniref:sigma-70 family RNA polymerase sigma factor n=1 Tax=Aquisphaera insulae TaxID=2712864 RepID=UPI00202E91DB|nr:sigma-70 family RNA polymerase sigma factor [Aquisphaera insulae]
MMRQDVMATTQDLLERTRLGEASARNELLELHPCDVHRTIHSRLDRRLASQVDVSDVVQEVLIEANRRLDTYLDEGPISFRAWLRQLEGDRIVDAHSSHVAAGKRSVTRENVGHHLPGASSLGLFGPHLSDASSPSCRLMKDEDREQVQREIENLPTKDREVLVMRHQEQLSTAEIADALGIAEGAVKVRLLRAVLRLRERMGLGV